MPQAASLQNSTSWIDRFYAFGAMGPDVKAYLIAHSSVVKAPAGSVIFGPGKPADNFLLLLSGTVRVQKTSGNGREIVLYRVSPGESCVLTTLSLLADEDYSAEGVAESEVEAVAVSRQAFDHLVATCDLFRKFVFNAYSTRLIDLIATIDEIAFSKIDIRLAQRLLRLANGKGQLSITHQALALELGTAREVVSRQLAEFQRRNWIGVARGCITLRDRKALENLAVNQ